MNPKLILSVLVIFITVPVLAEKSELIELNDLPINAKNSVLQHVAQSDIVRVEKITDEGLVKFEIEYSVKGAVPLKKSITVATNGGVIEMELVIPLSKLPLDALREIRKNYPKLKIQKVELVQLYYYEVEGIQEGNSVEFNIFPSGDILDDELTVEQED